MDPTILLALGAISALISGMASVLFVVKEYKESLKKTLRELQIGDTKISVSISDPSERKKLIHDLQQALSAIKKDVE